MEMVYVFLPAICLAILRDLWKMHEALHTIDGLKSLEKNVLMITGRLVKAFAPFSLLSPERLVFPGQRFFNVPAAFIPGPKLVGACLSDCFLL